MLLYLCIIFFFKQKTAYEMRISDWSSDVCSSDLYVCPAQGGLADDTDILRVHTPEYLASLRQHAPTSGYFPLDPDTHMNSHTLEAAQAAAGAGIAAEIGRASCRERVCQYV